jgi:hypothetical protein
MKRYLLLGFYRYYPTGGLNDIKASFNDFNELDLDDLYCDYDYYQLLDLKTRQQAYLQMATIEHEIEEKEIYDYDEEEKYKKNAIINWLKKNIE